MENSIKLQLNNDEALVLYDFITRLNESGFKFEDQAEQQVLWDIECMLEKVLVEPFKSDYKILLETSRKKIRDKN
jgi:hypothetical protein